MSMSWPQAVVFVLFGAGIVMLAVAWLLDRRPQQTRAMSSREYWLERDARRGFDA